MKSNKIKISDINNLGGYYKFKRGKRFIDNKLFRFTDYWLCEKTSKETRNEIREKYTNVSFFYTSKQFAPEIISTIIRVYDKIITL